MKKTLMSLGVIVVVLGVATWGYAHWPYTGYAPGTEGFYMGPGMHRHGMHGPGMHGPGMHRYWHMQGAPEAPYNPCWRATEQTPEQQEQASKWTEEQAKAEAEQYIKRFLPDYKLEKKTTE